MMSESCLLWQRDDSCFAPPLLFLFVRCVFFFAIKRYLALETTACILLTANVDGKRLYTCFASAKKNGTAAATRDEDGKNSVLSTRMDALGYDTTSALTPPTTTTTTAGGGGVECIDVTMASATGFAVNDASSIRPNGPQYSGRVAGGR